MTNQSLRWALLAASAVAVTATATAVITSALTSGDSPLSADQIGQELAATEETSPPGARPSAATADDAVPGASATPGDAISATTNNRSAVLQLQPAVVTVRCDGGLATLETWSPNPGYRADDPVRGPAAQVSIRFESDVAADYKVTLWCDGDGVIQGTAVVEPDDHGGGHGGSGKG